MPKPVPAPRLTFKTYQELLRVLSDSAMDVFRGISDELSPERRGQPARMEFGTVVRTFAIISGLVRRSIVVSRYIETLPVPTEEREHRLGPALDRVFRLFSAHKITVAAYNRAVDAEIDGELEDEFEDAMLDGDFDGAEREYDPDADVPGRPPSVLVAELCRDFGMIAHSIPPEWLKPVPAELRLLCARAAAAAIRPNKTAVRSGGAVRH